MVWGRALRVNRGALGVFHEHLHQIFEDTSEIT